MSTLARRGFAALMLIGGYAAAETITVQPGGSIQQAIQNAQTGDLIEVQPGIYTEQIWLQADDPITVRAVGGPSVTSIVAPDMLTQEALVIFDGGGSRAPVPTVLEGFTLVGDTADQPIVQFRLFERSSAELIGCDLMPVGVGSFPAIRVTDGGEVRIIRCSIEGFASTQQVAGLHVEHEPEVNVIETTFKNNAAEQQGGAVYFRPFEGGTLTIDRCTFDNNSTVPFGGAIAAEGFSGAGMLTIKDSTFTDNTASNRGGAIYARRIPLRITGSTFERNSAESDSFPRPGGAIYADAWDDNLGVSAHVIASNTFVSNFGENGSAINIRGPVDLLNNVVWKNNGGDFGSDSAAVVLFGDQDQPTSIVNNTFVANGPDDRDSESRNFAIQSFGGSGDLSSGAFANNILWDNGNEPIPDFDSDSFEATYNTFEGFQAGDPPDNFGPGNNGDQPMFTDQAGGDFRLLPGSTMIDSGSAPALPRDRGDLDSDFDRFEQIPTDRAGDPRRINDPSTPDTGLGDNPAAASPIPDRGALEFNPDDAPCVADLTGDRVLNIDDVLTFLQAFNAGCP